MPGRALQSQLIAWVAIAALSAYCLFWAGGWVATYYPAVRIWALIPAFAVVAAWMVVALRHPGWRPTTTLWPGFAAAMAAFTLSTMTSRQPRLSAEYLALAILLVAIYLILQRLMASPFFRPRFLGFTVIAAALVGVAYLAVTVPHWIAWWQTIGRPAAPPLRPFFEGLTFGNPSAVMTASVLLTAPAVAHIGGGSRGRRIAIGILIGLAGCATVISGSRAGWLALTIALVLVGLLWLAAPGRRARLAAAARSRFGRLAVLLVGGVAMVAGLVAAPGILLRATAGGESLRLAYWAAALRMFEASPVVGTGPGTWVPQRAAFTMTAEPDYYIPHAHNVYVQTLAEFGLVGALAGAVVIVVLGRLILGAVHDDDPARRRMGWAALFASLYFAAHQVLDFYANAPAILFCFAIPVAWLDATAGGTANLARVHLPAALTAPRFRRALAGAGVAALIASALFLGWSESAALRFSEGSALLEAGRPSEAVAPLTDVAEADPAMPPYHLVLGIALADAGDLTGAKEHLATAAEEDDLPESWLNLAAVQARLGDAAGADISLQRALRLGDQQPVVLLGAGTVELELERPAVATDRFVQALTGIPSLAGDGWWTATPERAAVWPNVLAAASAEAPNSSRLVMALETLDMPAAEATVAAMDGPEAATSDLVRRAWFGDDVALRMLEAEARAHPLDTGLVSWCAILLRRTGETRAAGQYTTWANTIWGDAGFGGYEVRVADEMPAAGVAGQSTLYYGQYTYRRPIPNVQLVDWLPTLIYEAGDPGP